MPITQLTHKGRRIVYTDYRACQNEAEMIALFHEAVAGIKQGNVRVLTLNNFEGVMVSNGFMDEVRSVSPSYKHLIAAKAILGTTGIKKLLLNTYSIITGIKSRAFDTEAEALDFLASIPE